MKTLKFALAAAILFTGTAAFADITTDSVIADYTAQGYTRIEIRSGLTQIAVEAIRGTEKLEVILDKATGAILKQEVLALGAFDSTTPGVTLRERNRDFVRLVSAKGDDAATGDDDHSAAGNDNDNGNDNQASNDDDNGDDNHAGNDDGNDNSANDDKGDDADETNANDNQGDDGDHGGDNGGDGEGDHAGSGGGAGAGDGKKG